MEPVSVSRHNRKQVTGKANSLLMHGLIFQFFYVYSDLISPQIVGDTQAPLLRIVRTKGKDGETISQYYDRPQYLPLVRHSFQTIQSELRLNSGDFVPFERGENFKEAVKTRSKESGKKLAQKAIDRVQSMVGKGQDTLPPLEENMCAIVNFDDSSQPGTHWLALFVNDKRELEFYDSFGQPPVFYNISTTTY
ncbi:uncharacterized protein TNCV_2889331 [Trichonephila clavipes]|nr:uncharacterized protein TNCV_2889331 [Trichonephila clavipes]